MFDPLCGSSDVIRAWSFLWERKEEMVFWKRKVNSRPGACEERQEIETEGEVLCRQGQV